MTTDFRPFNPPGDGFICATPSDAGMLGLLGGGISYSGVHFTRDQERAIYKLYGFQITDKPDSYPERAPPPGPKPRNPYGEEMRAWESADAAHRRTDPAAVDESHHMMMSGAKLSAARHAERDGLRAIAVLAKFCGPGEDPIRVLCDALVDAGYDAPVWDEDEDEDEE